MGNRTHAVGGTVVLREASPDVPGPERPWEMVERHWVTKLWVSPAMIRTPRARGADASAQDISSIHTLGSTGEPGDAETYVWLAADVFASRVPIINFSGGTEVGGSFLAPCPVEPIRSCSLGARRWAWTSTWSTPPGSPCAATS